MFIDGESSWLGPDIELQGVSSDYLPFRHQSPLQHLAEPVHGASGACQAYGTLLGLSGTSAGDRAVTLIGEGQAGGGAAAANGISISYASRPPLPPATWPLRPGSSPVDGEEGGGRGGGLATGGSGGGPRPEGIVALDEAYREDNLLVMASGMGGGGGALVEGSSSFLLGLAGDSLFGTAQLDGPGCRTSLPPPPSPPPQALPSDTIGVGFLGGARAADSSSGRPFAALFPGITR